MDLAREPAIDDRHPVRGSSTPQKIGYSELSVESAGIRFRSTGLMDVENATVEFS